MYEIANVSFNYSFHFFFFLATFSYSHLLIVLVYLNGASVTVSPEWQIIQKKLLLLVCLALYLYLNNQLEILSGNRLGYKYLYLHLHVIVFEGYSASHLKSETAMWRYEKPSCLVTVPSVAWHELYHFCD